MPTIPCPRCGGPLDPAGGLLWCPGCGGASLDPDAPPPAEPVPTARWGRDAALAQVAGSAAGLKLIGGFGVTVLPAFLVLRLVVMAGDDRLTDALIETGAALVANAAACLVILTGARKMARLEGRGWAVAAAVLVMVPFTSPCCVFGVPVGVRAFQALNHPAAREGFARVAAGAPRRYGGND